MFDGQTEILRLLLESADKDKYTPGVIHKIVELDAMDIWAGIWETVLDSELDTSWLLHLAVSYQNLQFVKHFIKNYPDSVLSTAHIYDSLCLHAVLKSTRKVALGTTNDANIQEPRNGSHYPLWYNNRTWSQTGWTKRTADGQGTQAEIRRELVMETIKKTQTMQKLLEILESSEGIFSQRSRCECLKLSLVNVSPCP